MPVKRPHDTWAAAPESSYPKHGPLRTGAKDLHARLLTGLAVVVTVAAGAAIFIALNAPRSQASAAPTIPNAINVPTGALASESATPGAPVPAPATETGQTTQTASLSVATASSAQVSVDSPAVDASAAPAPVIAPQLVAAAAAGPATAVTSPAPEPTIATPAASGPATAETSIRSTAVVIGGHTYDCYGQVAHLACDLKQ
jgi:hypothetical protein